MSDSEVDPTFSVLPARLRRRIDRAFDNAIVQAGHDSQLSEPGPSRKRRKVEKQSAGGFVAQDSVPAAGGFIVDDDAPAGGFVPEDTGERTSESSEDEDDSAHPAHTHIPLSLIPSALQLLDLQPDDEDVLSVFQNAASGWEGKGRADKADQVLRVSRKDWRAVCAALLDTSGGEGGDDLESAPDTTFARSDPEPEPEDQAMNDPEELEESEGSEEEYVNSEEDVSDEEDDDDDEYQGGGFVRSKSKSKAKASPKGKRRARPTSDSESSDGSIRPTRITARHKVECRKAFSLFFPDVPDEKLELQRIMIKDISRVAAVLKEKITAEEIVEMLEAFSSSPDKSVSLSDFETMMITAKLA